MKHQRRLHVLGTALVLLLRARAVDAQPDFQLWTNVKVSWEW